MTSVMTETLSVLPQQRLRLRSVADHVDALGVHRDVGEEFELSFPVATEFVLQSNQVKLIQILDPTAPSPVDIHPERFNFFSLLSKGQMGSAELDQLWKVYDRADEGRLDLETAVRFLQDVATSLGMTLSYHQAREVIQEHFECLTSRALTKEMFKFLFLQMVTNPVPSLQEMCLAVLSPADQSTYISFCTNLSPAVSRVALTASLASYGEAGALRSLPEMFEVGRAKHPDDMLVYVATLTGCRIPIYIQPSEDIGALKEKLSVKLHRDPDQIRLILAGKELEDGRTLSDYRTQPGATFHCVLRLRTPGA
jgi:ubiquitin C